MSCGPGPCCAVKTMQQPFCFDGADISLLKYSAEYFDNPHVHALKVGKSARRGRALAVYSFQKKFVALQAFAFRSTNRSLAGRLRLLASPRVRLACLRLAARVRCVLACSSAAYLHAAHRVLAALLARALTLAFAQAFALSTLPSPSPYIMHPRRCPRPRIRSRPRIIYTRALALALALA